MNFNLAGRRALVTGSTSGIGKVVARLLAAEGCTVFVNGRSPESVDRALRDLEGDCLPAVGDVSSAAGVAEILEQVGEIDILINNAGIFEPKPFEEIPDEDWEKTFEVNVMSGVRLSRALVGGMRERGWGRVIFISSESGVNIPSEMIHYGVSKTAQLGLARGLANHLQGTGVTVNSVLPGPTWTEGVATFVEQIAASQGRDVDEMKPTFVAELRPNSLIGRFAEPEEIASVVVFLCSSQAGAVTGASYRADGGIINSCF
jgi:NAD(P)-dependent dehydrogenase (short-subunit alcohol dehydrogenase family)